MQLKFKLNPNIASVYDSVEHVLLYCHIVKLFWYAVEVWLNSSLGLEDFSLCDSRNIVGYLENRPIANFDYSFK